MTDLISNITQRILAGTYEAPATGTYTPTLIVGLGGTGIKVLRQLKKNLSLHENQHIKLLGIDSDSIENTRDPSQYPSLDLGAELKILDQAQAMRMLAGAAANTANRHVLDFLPKARGKRNGIHDLVNGKINSQKGAGQFRRAGKLLFCANVSAGANLNHTFQDLRVDLVGLPAILSKEGAGYTIGSGVKIFVVSSIAGGQGAGCLIDCLALIRKHFNGIHDLITALCVLPGPLFDKRVTMPVDEAKAMRANGIGVLRELQALKQGELPQHEFVFDQNVSYAQGPLPLVSDIYLVDHHSSSMIPFHDLVDLCKGVACFLYAFTGTGMGAHKAASDINHKADNQPGADGMSKPFSALGVGAMTFPAGQLVEYGTRESLDRWLQKWLDKSIHSADDQTVGTLLASWQFDSLDLFRARLQPDVVESTYLGEIAQRRAVMKMADPEFLAKGDSKLKSFASVLEGYGKGFDSLRSATFAGIDKSLRAELLLWMVNGAGPVTSRLEVLTKAVAVMHNTLKDARDERIRLRYEFNVQKAVLIEKINYWGFGFDKKERTEYISVVNKLLTLQLNERIDVALAEVLPQILKSVISVRAEADKFIVDLETVCKTNQVRLAEMSAEKGDSCFMQTVVPTNKYAEWIASEPPVDVPDMLGPNSLLMEDLIGKAIVSVGQQYEKRVKAYNLISTALMDKALLGRMITIQRASDYMMHLKLECPPTSEMHPQKFLAGVLNDGNERLITHFSPPAGGAPVVPIEITNKHMVVCAQTFHGFPAAYWSGFDTADSHYRQDPWWSHTLPDFEKLSPLKPLSGDRAQVMTTLGLALAYELIYLRGSSYYQNVSFDEGTSSHWYNYFAKEPNKGAQELVNIGLIRPAPSSQTKIKAAHLLAKSLEDTLNAMLNHDSVEFRQTLTELLDEFSAKAGVNQHKKIIVDFVDQRLNKLISSADARRDVLEEIAKQLRAYADKLG